MEGVESITQVLPSFTGVASSGCLGSAFFLLHFKIEQLYLNDERVNITPSIKNVPCLFI